MAIKLAISSIAEEKAKYKSAITSWLMAIVLLFTIHYFMSFVFYLNESVVKMASDLCSDLVSKNMEELSELQKSEILDSYINSLVNGYNNGKLDAYSTNIVHIIETYGKGTVTKTEDGKIGYEPSNIRENLSSYEEDKVTLLKALFENQNSEFNKWLYNRDNSFLWYTQDAGEVTGAVYEAIYYFMEAVSNAATLKDDEEIAVSYNSYKKNSSKNNKDKFIDNVAPCFAMVSSHRAHNNLDGLTGDYEADSDAVKDKAKKDSSYFAKLEEFMYYVNFMQEYYNKNESEGKVTNLTTSPVSLIASYFKSSAFNIRDNTIVSSDANVTFCFLYTIFVFQSLLYFFAYVKRFFYIIILSIMAPIVIVYNFVSKI